MRKFSLLLVAFAVGCNEPENVSKVGMKAKLEAKAPEAKAPKAEVAPAKKPAPAKQRPVTATLSVQDLMSLARQQKLMLLLGGKRIRTAGTVDEIVRHNTAIFIEPSDIPPGTVMRAQDAWRHLNSARTALTVEATFGGHCPADPGQLITFEATVAAVEDHTIKLTECRPDKR